MNDNETGLYYLNSRYYNPEWGRYINADAAAGGTGVLLSHNVFAYSMNNPVNMTDPSGCLPGWLSRAAAAVKRHVTAVYRKVVNVVTKAKAYVSKKVAQVKVTVRKVASSIHNRITKLSSWASNTASGLIDGGSGYIANRAIKRTITGWTPSEHGVTMAIKKPATLSRSIISHASQYTGTAIFTTDDVIGDLSGKEYFSAFADSLSGAGGAIAGNLMTKAIGASIIASFLPEAAVEAGGFVLSIFIGEQIDKYKDKIEKRHYGR
ncbi:RHS repeat-associated core domain-containing protein [Clostridium fermenticellae]|uniref:RHS repeat-associated core domain-containing protein n=1 Tax=Clostridium fermenticellae TaxID=2068654 RepID=A0A386H647_9CLOT|nr:RHS repeat-associated core domain-containing protein [Clostridium fermenticellae]